MESTLLLKTTPLGGDATMNKLFNLIHQVEINSTKKNKTFYIEKKKQYKKKNVTSMNIISVERYSYLILLIFIERDKENRTHTQKNWPFQVEVITLIDSFKNFLLSH